jgi:hypothetical protein
MSIIISKLVATTQLTNASAGYGTAVPAGVTQIIKRAVFSNTGAVPRTITVNVVPTAGAASVANQIINARTLQSGETYVSAELSGMELIAGDQLFAQASANTDVNMTVSGIQVS